MIWEEIRRVGIKETILIEIFDIGNVPFCNDFYNFFDHQDNLFEI
jgi:hypothetical protein